MPGFMQLPGYKNETEIFPKFCADCKWSKLERDSSHFMRCFHPKVNGADPYALGAGEGRMGGVECRQARERGGIFSRNLCGIKGKLWEAK